MLRQGLESPWCGEGCPGRPDHRGASEAPECPEPHQERASLRSDAPALSAHEELCSWSSLCLQREPRPPEPCGLPDWRDEWCWVTRAASGCRRTPFYPDG